MTTQGVAFQEAGGCNCYTLTPDSYNVVGAIWSPTTIDMSVPQDLTFELYLGADNAGGDGIMFVIQTASSGIGPVGNTLGYGGITNSVGIEVDTYGNVPAVPLEIWGDHVAINQEGTSSHDYAAPVGTAANIEDGVAHILNVQWDPTLDVLGVFLDGTYMVGYNGDIITDNFGGSSDVYFGFTSSTGGAKNLQRVCMYRNADFSASEISVCPGTEITFNDNSSTDLGDANMTEWAWDFGDGGTSAAQDTTYAFTSDGTYSVTLTMTDASGCTATHTMDIEVLPPLDIDSSFINIDCHGDSTGVAIAEAMSGTGPYSYIWDDPLTQVDDSAVGLIAGTYTCTVTDDLGCQGQTTVTVTENSAIVISPSVTPDAGGGTGAIDITVSGGTPGAGGYTYSWSPGGETTEDLTGLATGTYTVTVTDSLGCIATMDIFVNSTQGLSEAAIAGFKVYPNPTNGLLNISGKGEFGIRITDVQGRLVHAGYGTELYLFELSGVEKGMYFVTISNEEGEFVERVILK